MLQNNKLMRKMNFTEKASGLLVKGQKGRSRSRGPKRDPSTSSSNAYYYCRKSELIKKICFKYKEMLKKKGGKDTNEASTNEKS